jgi:hypothetical protein
VRSKTIETSRIGCGSVGPTGRRFIVENVAVETIKRNMDFAYTVCKDTNAYTAKEKFWDIVKEGSDALLENKEYRRSIFPALKWK